MRRHWREIDDGDIRIDGAHAAADGARQRGRIHARSQHEVHRRVAVFLRIGHVPARAIDAEVEAIFFDVFDDADDGEPGTRVSRAASADAAAERILSRPGLLRELLRDDDDPRRIARVRVIEEAAANEAHAEQLQITGSDDAMRGDGDVVRPRQARGLPR